MKRASQELLSEGIIITEVDWMKTVSTKEKLVRS